MEPEPLSHFPSEASPPVEQEQPRAASVSSGISTRARPRPATDTAYALDQQVQFFKARSHVAHALSEGKRYALAVNAEESTAHAELFADRSHVDQIEAREAALLFTALLTAVACVILLPSFPYTPIRQTELLPTLAGRTFQMIEPAFAPHIRQPDLHVWAATPTSERAVAQSTAPPATDVTARAAPITLPAVRATFTGQLIVDSVPTGATVLINQRPVGRTPLHLTDYPAGSYAIWVERDGYERWTAGVRVQADTTTHIRPSLLSKPEPQQRADAE
jgi:hypothetical protein